MMSTIILILSVISLLYLQVKGDKSLFLSSTTEKNLTCCSKIISKGFESKETIPREFGSLQGSQRLLEENDLDNYTKFLSLPYVGTWKSTEKDNVNLFGEFTKQTGKARVSFNQGFGRQNRLLWFEEKQVPLKEVQLIIIDGEYHDDTLYLISLEDDTYQELNITDGVLTIHKKGSPIGPLKFCNVQLRIDFNNMNIESVTLDKTLASKNEYIQLEMSSQNCSVSFQAIVYIDSFDSHSKTRYNIFFRVLMIICTLTNIKLASKILRFSHQRNKTTPVMFIVLAVWDMIFLANMYVPPGMSSEDLTKGILFLEMLIYEAVPSFMLLIPFWRKTQTSNIHLNGAQINQLLWVYVFLPTFAMVFFIVLSVQAFFRPIFLYLINFYLLPQIVYNFIRGNPVLFDPSTIALIISVRPLYLLYLKGYPGNIYQVSTSFVLSVFILMTLVVQIIILYMQSNSGVRFFIPRDRLWSWHNYLDISSQESLGTELMPMRKICTICMEERSECPAPNEICLPEVKPLLERLKIQPEKILKTNCKHKFHAVCLIEWMMVNMKCPKCEAVLKPLE